MKLYEKISALLSTLPEVEAVALSGSSTALINDEFSDYDIYVYYTSPISRKTRKSLLGDLGKGSFGCSLFEEGDLIEPKNEVSADIMYRDLKWIENQIGDVWEKHYSRLGYTTCFIFNVKNSVILFDRNGLLKELIERCSTPYPEQLRKNIIEMNLSMIDNGHTYNFRDQIATAVARKDLVSLNHRVAAFLACYFDILLAISRELHPGEKKLIKYAEALNLRKPIDFENDINRILSSTYTDIEQLPALLDETVEKLKNLID